MAISQPVFCPSPGLTFSAHAVTVGDSTVTVGTDEFRQLDILSIDCFPLTRFAESASYTEHEQRLLNRAIVAADQICVTIPEPPPLRGRSDWLRGLVDTSVPKPGWVWIDSVESISDVLVGKGLRSNAPDYPHPDTIRTQRPANRPEIGLTIGVANPVRCQGAADRWLVLTCGGDELIVSLVDCYCDSATYGPYEASWNAMAKYRDTLAITLPRPESSIDWIATLKPGSEHAGWLWLDAELTLNEYLVAEGFSKREPG